MAETTAHIRIPMPRKGGNSFYRDKNDYTKFALTLCGAPVTDKDVDYRTANTKRFRNGPWEVCKACRDIQDERQKCGECGGSGKLTRLGGDWGKTPDTEVPCWKCNGSGKEAQ